MADNRLQNREQTYRSASRAFAYFVTGLSALLFLATALFFEMGESPVLRVLDAAAIVLFAMAVVALGTRSRTYRTCPVSNSPARCITRAGAAT